MRSTSSIKKRLKALDRAQGWFTPLPVLVEAGDLAERFNGDQDQARRYHHPAEVHFSWESFINNFI
ncbi:MAG: hypothetical protein Q7J24_06090 [Desulfomicrobium sp.]|nr:hypothetical protein [Desulfomicrobium sp.]